VRGLRRLVGVHGEPVQAHAARIIAATLAPGNDAWDGSFTFNAPPRRSRVQESGMRNDGRIAGPK
jgi:hypothetical protein